MAQTLRLKGMRRKISLHQTVIRFLAIILMPLHCIWEEMKISPIEANGKFNHISGVYMLNPGADLYGQDSHVSVTMNIHGESRPGLIMRNKIILILTELT